MEWARHRFRISSATATTTTANTGSSSIISFNKIKTCSKVLTSVSCSLATLIFAISVISLPCAVLSAEGRGNFNSNDNVGDRNSNNFSSVVNPNHREILHSKDDHGVGRNSNNDNNYKAGDVWRSISVDAGSSSLVPRDGLSELSGNSTLSSEGHKDGNNKEVTGDESNNASHESEKVPNPPHHHKEGKNVTHNGNHGHGKCPHDGVKNCTKTTHGKGDKDSESEPEDSDRIETILRDIFFDEFEADEELEGEEGSEDAGHSASTSDESHLSRSSSIVHGSNHSVHDKSQVPISRHIRSEPTSHHEGRAGPKGKGSGKSPSGGNSSAKGSKKGAGKQKKAGKGSSSGSKGSDLAKYNEYMDSVFKRMNMMIKSKKMDPLRVNLYAGPNKLNQKGGSKASAKSTKKKYSPRMNLDSEEDEFGEDEFDEDEEDDLENGPARRDVFLNISRHEQHDREDKDHHGESVRKIRALLESVNNGTGSNEGDSPRGNKNDSKPKKPKQGGNGNRNKENGGAKNKGQGGKKSEGGKGSGNKSPKNKKNRAQGSRPTRGILHGLSSLKRDGNVNVIKQGDKARLVRANFFLGPVSLEIMPKKGKGGESEKPVAATATAPKLKGVLEVRLKKGSPTRIRRLRVYPPKNVKVDGGATATSGTKKGSSSKKRPQQYGKVTPMATARLRQIASTVVRQADKSKKSP